MPTGMLHSSNAAIDIGGLNISGQTFRVQETQVLQWIDLQLDFPFIASRPTIEVFRAGADHKPWGPVLSRDIYISGVFDAPGVAVRTRFSMGPITLYPDEYYCIVVYYWPVIFGGPLRWFYNAGDNEYPWGVRISSNDRGTTWTVHYNDDHLFYAWGKPPTLDPTPQPPIPNFFVIDIKYMCTATGYKIQVITNVPAHLYLCWTNIEPEKHKHPLYRRGSTFTESIQYCFVAWYSIEQEEPGDTIYHTFIAEPWEICETRWQTIIGEIQNQWSPSVGPILKKHRTEPITITIPVIFREQSLEGYGYPWQPVHDALVGEIHEYCSGPYDLTCAGSRLTVSHFIWRAALSFPSFSLPPNALICHIDLRLYVTYAIVEYHKYPYLIVTPGRHQDPPIPSDYGGQLLEMNPLGQFDIRNFIINQYNDIPLDFAALRHINPKTHTKYSLRGEIDLINFEPVRVYNNYIRFLDARYGNDYESKLIVKYEQE